MVTAAMFRRPLLLGRKALTNPDSVLKADTLFCQQRSVQSWLRSSHGHYSYGELDHNEGRAPRSRCLRTVVLEKTLEKPLGSKEIKPINLKGNQS